MKEMSLVEHLEELRARVIRIVIIIIVSFALCYSFGSQISELLLVPLREVLGGKIYDGQIVFLGVFVFTQNKF